MGVVLYEMLTGWLPFRGEHEQAIVYSILKEKPEPIVDIKADIPVSIEQVVSKALEKDPGKRYHQALKKVLASHHHRRKFVFLLLLIFTPFPQIPIL